MKVIKHKDKWYLQSDTGYKEILLSTDELLIKDGVQAIDDDFLEWIVKNPSCEEVIIEEFLQASLKYPKGSYKYKIIIQKEEPKQVWEQIIEDCGGEEAFMKSAGLLPKQETLEEAAKKYANKIINGFQEQHIQENLEEYIENYNKLPNGVFKTYVGGYIDGAKWQQEQDRNKYSEEDMKHAFFSGCQSERQIKPRVKCWEEFIEQFKKK